MTSDPADQQHTKTSPEELAEQFLAEQQTQHLKKLAPEQREALRQQAVDVFTTLLQPTPLEQPIPKEMPKDEISQGKITNIS
jgi:hypothetical protein